MQINWAYYLAWASVFGQFLTDNKKWTYDCCSGLRKILFIRAKKEAYKTLIKEQQRFWKRILIVDDDADLTLTLKEAVEESNNNNDVNKRIEVYTSNDPPPRVVHFPRAHTACILPGLLAVRPDLREWLQSSVDACGLPFVTMFMDKSVLAG